MPEGGGVRGFQMTGALLFQYDLAVFLCNQQKQVIVILVIQLSKQTAPKYASEISQNS